MTTGLTGEEKDAIRKLWIDILEGRSNIKVRTGTKKFSYRMLAQIAKLLQGPAGRELIALLSTPQQDPARQIRIVAELPEGVETMPGSFAKPIEEPRPWETAAEWAFGAPVIKDEDVLEEEKDQPAKDVDYPVAASAAELNQAILKRATKGVTLGGTKYRFGAGQGSYVRMASGDEPMVDRGLNAIASPGFVTLGHELGHALRNLHGGSLKNPMLYGDKAQALGLEGDASLDKELWSDIEEFVNITQTENALRAEHGLTARSYHDVKARATIARFQLNARYLSIVREAPVDVRSALTNASETLAKELRGASSVDFGMAQVLDQKRREVDEFEQRVPSLVNRARRIKDPATRQRQVFGGPVGRVKSKLGFARDVLDVVNRIEGILIASIGRSEEEEAGVGRDVEWLESQRERITQLITPKEAT